MEATKTGVKYYNRNYSTFVEYEYRGHKYEVEYSNCFNYLVSPPSVQHKNAQYEIDRMIEQEHAPTEWKYEGSAQEGFDLFWEYV